MVYPLAIYLIIPPFGDPLKMIIDFYAWCNVTPWKSADILVHARTSIINQITYHKYFVILSYHILSRARWPNDKSPWWWIIILFKHHLTPEYLLQSIRYQLFIWSFRTMGTHTVMHFQMQYVIYSIGKMIFNFILCSQLNLKYVFSSTYNVHMTYQAYIFQ